MFILQMKSRWQRIKKGNIRTKQKKNIFYGPYPDHPRIHFHPNFFIPFQIYTFLQQHLNCSQCPLSDMLTCTTWSPLFSAHLLPSFLLKKKASYLIIHIQLSRQSFSLSAVAVYIKGQIGIIGKRMDGCVDGVYIMSRQGKTTKNMLGMDPYYDQFFAHALDNLRRTLLSAESVDNIEIEVKYAEFNYFCSYNHEGSFRDASKEIKERVNAIGLSYSEQFLRGMLLMSKQSILLLNPLGRQLYQLNSGFNQAQYRKFYHTRDFLVKMCKYNELNNYALRPIRSDGPINIYHELSLNNAANTLRMTQQDELRLDLYVKEGVAEGLRGRYSYSAQNGWKKTEKVPLCTQMDFIFSERAFRLAINREVETDVSASALKEISQFLKAAPRMTDIRLKRLLRVTKGEVSQYALSEIYNINDRNKNTHPDFPSMITAQPAQLNAFLQKIFINFYSPGQREFSKFEIESEFTKPMTKHLKKLIKNDRMSEVKHELECAIEELYALFFCDHVTKVKEVGWLNAKEHNMPETRLENEFGNYMRGELYAAMQHAR